MVLVFLGIASANAAEELKRQAAQAEVERKERVYRKYGHGDVAEKILNRTIWVSETAEQLRDSLGSPADIDEKVLKTKRKEIWKYFQTGANRFGLRITLENGLVVGWDEKM